MAGFNLIAVRRILGLVALLVLSGCTTTSGSYDFKPEEREALVVLSTRVLDECGGSIVTASLNYEGLVGNDVERGLFLFRNSLVKLDFADPPGYFHIRPLKAGEYRFTTFDRVSTQGSRRSGDLNVRFRLEPGRVYYLGELQAELIGCGAVKLTVRDERLRDGGLFDKKMDLLRSSAFDYSALQALREAESLKSGVHKTGMVRP